MSNLNALYPSATPQPDDSDAAAAVPQASGNQAASPAPAPSTDSDAAAPVLSADVLYPSQGGADARPALKAEGEKPEPPKQDNAAKALGYQDTSADLKDVRWDEPAPTTVTDYSTAMHLPSDMELRDPGEFSRAQGAMLSEGVGITQANAAFKMAMEAVRSPYAGSNDEAMAQLQAEWGGQTESRMAQARALTERINARWPGFKSFLNETRLGSNPNFIKLMAGKAARRGIK